MNRHEFYDNLNKYYALSHSTNYKYYQKIDLGNGDVRYFYSKEEWDAYQRELSTKKNTNQNISNETLQKIQQSKLRKQNQDKNAQYESHQGDRYSKPQPTNEVKNDSQSGSAKTAEDNAKKQQEYLNKKKEETKNHEEYNDYADKLAQALRKNLANYDAQGDREREARKAYWNDKTREIDTWRDEDRATEQFNDELMRKVAKILKKNSGDFKVELYDEYLSKDDHWIKPKSGRIYYQGDNWDEVDKLVDEGWKEFEKWQNSETKAEKIENWNKVSQKNYDAQRLEHEDTKKANKSYNDAIIKYLNEELSDSQKGHVANMLNNNIEYLLPYGYKIENVDKEFINAIEDFIKENKNKM